MREGPIRDGRSKYFRETYPAWFFQCAPASPGLDHALANILVRLCVPVFDILLSFVLDTALLPISIPAEAFFGVGRKPSPP